MESPARETKKTTTVLDAKKRPDVKVGSFFVYISSRSVTLGTCG